MLCYVGRFGCIRDNAEAAWKHVPERKINWEVARMRRNGLKPGQTFCTKVHILDLTDCPTPVIFPR